FVCTSVHRPSICPDSYASSTPSPLPTSPSLPFYPSAHPRPLPSFPTRRSSDLPPPPGCVVGRPPDRAQPRAPPRRRAPRPQGGADRKSTRLNSSHVSISYAVFCLKKKKRRGRKRARASHT